MRSLILFSMLVAAGACRQQPSASPPTGDPREAAGDHGRATRPQTTGAARGRRGGDPSDLFLVTLQAGDYDALPGVLRQLTGAYASEPRSARRSLHLGLAHLWRIGESGRAGPDPSMLDSVVLAEHYIGEAGRLDPDDARIPCWHGSVRRSLGSLTGNDALMASGVAQLRDSAARDPAFGLFCLSLPAAHAPRADSLFGEALEAQWRSVEICSGLAIDRARPPRTRPPADPRGKSPAIVRACFNTPAAPHNSEGFLLNMGDLLVKSGDAGAARTVYGWARSSPDFERWPHRAVLEQRISHAVERARAFDAVEDARRRGLPLPPEPELVSRSDIACVACHQR